MKGQIVTMVDRAYLTQAMPMLVVWGADDIVIPVKHAENVARIAPGAVVEVLPNSGHFPHKDHPDRFVKIVQRLRQGDPAGVVPPRALALSCSATAPPSRSTAPRPARPPSPLSPPCAGEGRSGCSLAGRPAKL